MKIVDVRAAVLKGLGDWILAQVITDEGTYGIGEAFPTFQGLGSAARQHILWMKNVLVGEDPTNVQRLARKMFHAYLYRGSAQTGALTAAVSGVETALWDLTGKVMGVPVYKLLGGKFRDRIRVYSDFHAGETIDPAAYAERAKEVVAKGFTALKFDLDVPMPYERDPFNRSLSNAELHLQERIVAAIREAVGPDIDLAVDCHSAYDVNSAIKLAQALEPYNLMWLEEPVPPENVAAMAAVAAATRTPICAGENLFTYFGFRDLLERQAVRLVEPDIQKTGGLIEGKRIADLANLYYVPFAPHCVATPVGTLASVHLCAAVANFLILEYHMVAVPSWAELAVSTEPIVKAGYIAVPEEPGLGVTLNKDAVREYLIEGDLEL